MKKLILPIIFLFFLITFPLQVEGASLLLSPGSESFSVGDSFSVELRIDTAGDSINTAQATIYFPVDVVKVLSVSKENSIFSLWPETPTFSNLTGEISFIGGLPHPGFSGEGKAITINFKLEKEGEMLLSFGESKILADDGKGTNILVLPRKDYWSPIRSELSKHNNITMEKE